MSVNWQVFRNGKSLGQFNEQQIRTLASKNQILATDCLWREGLKAPIPAGKVKGLFQNTAAPSTRGRVDVSCAATVSDAEPVANAKSRILSPDSHTWLGLPRPVVVSLAAFVAVCLVFVGGLIWSAARASYIEADNRCKDAMQMADAWLASAGRLVDAEALRSALANAGNNKKTSPAVKTQVSQTLERLRKAIESRKIESLFDSALKAIAASHLHQAQQFLADYASVDGAARVAEAKLLIDEIENATSDAKVIESLAALGDEEYSKAIKTGQINDGKVTNKKMIAARAELIESVRPNVEKVREAIKEKKAEEEHARRIKAEEENKRLAEERERQRQIAAAEDAKKQAALRNPVADALQNALQQPPVAVAIQDLARFPSDYVGKRVQIKSVIDVRSDSLQRVDDSGFEGEIWSMDVHEDKDGGIGWPIFLRPTFGQIGKVSLIMTADWARALAKEFKTDGAYRARLEVVVMQANYMGRAQLPYFAAILLNVAPGFNGQWMAQERAR